jgi:hypothetical protein
MENNYSSTDHSGHADVDLSLPHFDEDATLLSARPVVPLHEVNDKTRSRRGVIFGLTILAAILVGAISATLFLIQSGENSDNAADAEVSEPIVPFSGAAGGASAESAEARLSALTEPNEDPRPIEEPITHDSSRKRQPPARNPVKPTRVGRSDDERAEDFESDERELRRAERRDARREARRQRRDRREQVGDELLRIREIFEGSPRP